MTILTTPRLRLEPIGDAHFDGLYAMNSIPEVMRYITGKPDTPDDTRNMIERVKARWAEFGFSWWAIIEKASGQLIGACCVQHLGRDPANPLELGWRLRPEKWGQGFASEAAQRCAQFAFEELDTPLVTAVCNPENQASSTVMQRLGMTYQREGRWYDMDCSLYQMTREEWIVRGAARA